MKPWGEDLPKGKGSKRLASPPGEDVGEFFFRFMARKLAKTGWKSGKAEQRDVRHVEGGKLEKPFISLLDALVEGGWANTWGEARDILKRLADLDPRVGLSEKAGSLRYWIRRTDPGEDDF